MDGKTSPKLKRSEVEERDRKAREAKERKREKKEKRDREREGAVSEVRKEEKKVRKEETEEKKKKKKKKKAESEEEEEKKVRKEKTEKKEKRKKAESEEDEEKKVRKPKEEEKKKVKKPKEEEEKKKKQKAESEEEEKKTRKKSKSVEKEEKKSRKRSTDAAAKEEKKSRKKSESVEKEEKKPRSSKSEDKTKRRKPEPEAAAAAPNNETKKAKAAPVALDRYGFADRVATEDDVGIRGYLTSTIGFDGTLKHRFSDFVVNEIDAGLRVVHVTDMRDPLDGVAAAAAAAAAGGEASAVAADDEAAMRALLTSELYDKVCEAVAKGEQVVFTVPLEHDRDARIKLHNLVRSLWPGKVHSGTQEGKTRLSVGRKIDDRDKRVLSEQWPRDRPPFLKFAIAKSNMDTNALLADLAHRLHINEKVFHFGGLKDKRAVTTQAMTAKHLLPSKLLQAVKEMRNVRVGNFEFVAEDMTNNDHWGNRFDVVLRFVSAPDEQLAEAVAQVRVHGFVNYFGLQRFGTTPAGTHLVGLAIMRGEYANAVNLILSGGCPSWVASRDVNKALREVRRNSIEFKLLSSLARSPTNFNGALQSLPSQMRTLYLHAYQSYLWNSAASVRIARGSRERAEIGDIVLVRDAPAEAAAREDALHSDDLTFNAVVKILTAEDVGAYALSDVLIPVPGPGVTMPTNFVGEEMRGLMVRNGVPWEGWSEIAKQYPIQGGYRKLVSVPEDLKFEVKRYDGDADELLPNDVALLDGSMDAVVRKNEGKFKALRVTFSLRKGGFATMFFRELLKRSTGRDYQEEQRIKWEEASGATKKNNE